MRGTQEFCIADPFFTKNQQMDLKPKRLYSPDYNLLFDIIAISGEAFFVLIYEFIDACGIQCQVLLFDGLPF